MEFLGKAGNDGKTKEIKTGWLVFSKHHLKHYEAMRKARYTIEVEVNFIPFPSEEARKEAYRKWVRAFLSSRLKQSSPKSPPNSVDKFNT
ncbi:MAG: hypothetical protein ABID83_05180 [Candidatus Omnitrophota bacterium]